jgi:hypothetical protein
MANTTRCLSRWWGERPMFFTCNTAAMRPRSRFMENGHEATEPVHEKQQNVENEFASAFVA